MKKIICLVLFLLPFMVSAASLRIEGDRAWLKANDASLVEVLHLFRDRGVQVLVDPALDVKSVTGDWENTKVDRLIEQLVSPYSYLVEQKRVKGPLGDFFTVDTIQVYSDGNRSAARSLASGERVLDVVIGPDGKAYVRGEIMVGFGEGSDVDDLKTLLRKVNGTVIEVIDPPGIYRIKINNDMSVEEALAIAQEHPGVKAVESNAAFKQEVIQTDSIVGKASGINLNLLPGETAVAVFDSGLDPQYGNLPFIRGMYNAVDPSAPMSDPVGHGTLMAMVASGAVTPLGAEPSDTGVPVLAVRTFDENGYTSSEVLMNAINYAAQSGVEVISMSWGSENNSAFVEQAMNYASQKGIQLYAAVGNENTGIPIYPASVSSVIGVGGLAADGSVWEHSNEGSFVTEYWPAFAEFNGQTSQGTSISTAYAAGQAAGK